LGVGGLPIPTETEVAIVGGGPIGLALGCLLSSQGIDCVIFERRTAPAKESRAFGIHPPALKVLQKAGVAGELIQRGVRITGGASFSGQHPLGRMALIEPTRRFPFVLSVPQTATEAVLERRLCELAPNALIRGADVVPWGDKDGGSYLRIQGRPRRRSADPDAIYRRL
jgi:2-polyprenyl-6-methoxyphenol hydroxylase-like FAD-dependent oxidoreductase